MWKCGRRLSSHAGIHHITGPARCMTAGRPKISRDVVTPVSSSASSSAAQEGMSGRRSGEPWRTRATCASQRSGARGVRARAWASAARAASIAPGTTGCRARRPGSPSSVRRGSGATARPEVPGGARWSPSASRRTARSRRRGCRGGRRRASAITASSAGEVAVDVVGPAPARVHCACAAWRARR